MMAESNVASWLGDPSIGPVEQVALAWRDEHMRELKAKYPTGYLLTDEHGVVDHDESCVALKRRNAWKDGRLILFMWGVAP